MMNGIENHGKDNIFAALNAYFVFLQPRNISNHRLVEQSCYRYLHFHRRQRLFFGFLVFLHR